MNKTLILRWTRHALLTACVAIFAVSPAFAQHENDHPAGHGSEHEYHENTVALFVGFAKEGSHHSGPALGIEYEYRLNASFGIGALAEHTFGDFDSWVFALPFAYHTGRWKFYVAPGIEDGHAGSESLVRLGGEYGFRKGQWEISPQVDIDFVDGKEIFVLGVTFGRGF